MKRFVVLSIAIAVIYSPPTLGAEISTWAVSDITQKSYPKIYSQWGAEWVVKLNKMQHQAAKKAAQSPECDAVDMVALSGESVPKQKALFFVDCANGKRFYIADTDLSSGSNVVSKQAMTAEITDQKAVEECSKRVQATMNYPSTFKSSIFNHSVYRAPGGNVVATIDFKGKNGFGAELPMTARCVFDEKGMADPEITNR